MSTLRAERVTCPYCTVGWGMVDVECSGTARSVKLDDPVKCNRCANYFKVQLQVTLRGVGLDYRHNAPGIERGDKWVS